MTNSMWRSLFGGLSVEDEEVLEALKKGEVVNGRVVDYSAVVKDADEIAKSEKFSKFAKKANRIAARQRS